ncbi:hypothetical protein [Parafrankia sp. BMG5.11]|uniref:hypothetical protein n=1 Tax=Parafrankia sp. BMG5.11 TaxID=222540 RepID=UPI0014042C4B|nr:hypothetical protein [Parafrankia sp. BMG5.11]
MPESAVPDVDEVESPRDQWLRLTLARAPKLTPRAEARIALVLTGVDRQDTRAA